MNIYPEYVFANRLVSPRTGYSCRIITKQNINQFGFSSREELLKEYPEFPGICSELQKVRSTNLQRQNVIIHSKNQKESRDAKILEYNKNRNLCKYCGQSIPYELRSNLFCDKLCYSKAKIKLKSKSPPRKQKLYYYVCKFCGSNASSKKRENFWCNEKVCVRLRRSEIGKICSAKQPRRSKDEIKLYDLLTPFFDLSHNIPIANGWDADIILKDHKIAILWNGPWHYKEMGFSNHSLKQVVNRDCIKIEEFEKLGWSILIYQDNEWTPETAFIDIILRVGELHPGDVDYESNLDTSHTRTI
jgi:hypothetical protein